MRERHLRLKANKSHLFLQNLMDKANWKSLHCTHKSTWWCAKLLVFSTAVEAGSPLLKQPMNWMVATCSWFLAEHSCTLSGNWRKKHLLCHVLWRCNMEKINWMSSFWLIQSWDLFTGNNTPWLATLWWFTASSQTIWKVLVKKQQMPLKLGNTIENMTLWVLKMKKIEKQEQQILGKKELKRVPGGARTTVRFWRPQMKIATAALSALWRHLAWICALQCIFEALKGNSAMTGEWMIHPQTGC